MCRASDADGSAALAHCVRGYDKARGARASPHSTLAMPRTNGSRLGSRSGSPSEVNHRARRFREHGAVAKIPSVAHLGSVGEVCRALCRFICQVCGGTHCKQWTKWRT